ncbi:MAG: zinc-dependent metalloprotease family protein [Rhodospirillaceae bacterium]|nr:zinc-dependent metalloprotease family protein [Rhodospirillaceae bacterium]
MSFSLRRRHEAARAIAALLALLTAAPLAAQDRRDPPPALEANRPSTQAQINGLPAAGGQLFIADAPSPGGDRERALAAEPRVVRARSVAIDIDHLNGMLTAQPLQLDDSGSIASATNQHDLNLFDDFSVRVVKLSQERDDLGNIVWRGGIIDDPYGSATIVIDGAQVTASIVTRGRTISVMPAADGSHVIREVNERSSRAAFDPASRVDDWVKPPRPEGVAPTLPQQRTGDRPQDHAANTLRILVVYTAKAAGDIANMSSTVSLAMADLNTTLANSQTHTVAQLVGLERVTYTEGTSSSAILDDASNRVGDFARIHDMRAVVDADLVAVLASYGNENCGIAWKNDDIDQFPNSLASYVRYGVSVTNSLNCLPSTFTHEVGHNLGASHDRFVEKDAVAGPQGYNYGYIDTTARFRDIMAYDDECDSLNISCPRIQYFSNPSINYNGRPIGVPDSDPKAANNARKLREIAPSIARLDEFTNNPATPMLAVFVTGTGTVTSSAGGINCGQTCAASITGGGQVTLTAAAAAGWQFTGWSGACSGTAPCAVTMSTSRNVQATFQPSLRLGTVYSSAQGSSQSFLRFANTGSSAGTVNVLLADSSTGQAMGTWTSSSIAAGAALQVPITTVETALTPGTAKPQYFAAAVQSQMTGYIQHVLYRPADGTLTNLSTCDAGVTVNATQVANVHTTILDFGFPSSIAVTNTGSSSATATLGIFDSTNGARLGTYTTSSIPANSQAIISIATIESSTGIRPTSTQYHYTVKLEGTFTGSLQHLVNNLGKGVITDMTTVCTYGTVSTPPSTLALRQPGPVFSSAQSASQSFLRFFNTGTTAGTVNVALHNSATGANVGSWTSPSIPAGASAQYPITTVETGLNAGVTKPQYYTTLLQTQISGFFQHVLYRPADGTLTNLSTCDAGVASSPGNLINVHSSILDFGFPSSVVVSNPGTSAVTATLGIFDARNNARLGTYTTASVPAGGRLIIPIATIQAAIGYTPASDVYHYVIKAEGTFTGFLQHLVTNSTAGVITDMTTMCQLPASAVRYNNCYPTSCNISLGTPANGQIKRPGGGYENFRLSLTAGQAYTIDVKGSSTGDGTLVRPYVYIFDTSGTVVKDGGGGGTGTNARLSFTPATTGNHTIQVTVYIYTNNAGTFTVTVN